MKKTIAVLVLATSSLSFAASEDYCVSFESSAAYSPISQNLYCGTQGKEVFSSSPHIALSKQAPYLDWISSDEVKKAFEAAKTNLGLVHFDYIKVEGYRGFEILSPRSESAPAESIVVATRDVLTVGFSKEKIGYRHSVLSSNGKLTTIQDDLGKTALSEYLSKNGFVRIVNAGEREFIQYNVYIKK